VEEEPRVKRMTRQLMYMSFSSCITLLQRCYFIEFVCLLFEVQRSTLIIGHNYRNGGCIGSVASRRASASRTQHYNMKRTRVCSNAQLVRDRCLRSNSDDDHPDCETIDIAREPHSC